MYHLSIAIKNESLLDTEIKHCKIQKWQDISYFGVFKLRMLSKKLLIAKPKMHLLIISRMIKYYTIKHWETKETWK